MTNEFLKFKGLPLLGIVDSIPGDFPNEQHVQVKEVEKPLTLFQAYNKGYVGGVLPDHCVVLGNFADMKTGRITIPDDAGKNVRVQLHSGANEVVLYYTNIHGEKIALTQRYFTADSHLFGTPEGKDKKSKSNSKQNYLNMRKGWKR